MLNSLQFFPGYLVFHSFVHIVSNSGDTLLLVPSPWWGTYLVLLPHLPSDHCFLDVLTKSGTIELLMLFLSLWLSSFLGLSFSEVWGSFSCSLWYLIQHQYILVRVWQSLSVKGESQYFRYLNIFAGHMVSVTTAHLCCY